MTEPYLKLPNPSNDQKEFMTLADQTTDDYNIDQMSLYADLIVEEVHEFMEALTNEPPENVIKEATDLMVVTLGFMHSMGINPNDAWELVHENNMFKVKNKPSKDTNGKVIKSPESITHKATMMESLKRLLS